MNRFQRGRSKGPMLCAAEQRGAQEVVGWPGSPHQAENLRGIYNQHLSEQLWEVAADKQRTSAHCERMEGRRAAIQGEGSAARGSVFETAALTLAARGNWRCGLLSPNSSSRRALHVSCPARR